MNVPVNATTLTRSRGNAGEQPTAGKLILQMSVEFLALHPLSYLPQNVLALLLLLSSFSLLNEVRIYES